MKTSIINGSEVSRLSVAIHNKEQSDAQAEIRRLQKELKRVTDERDILKKAAVDSIGQRNSHVKTWSCGGFLNETDIYSKGKSICF
jgi:transposase